VAARVTASVDIPTIGIGAGAGCDGQVLVFHDLVGLEDRLAPRFVRRYATLGADASAAVAAWATDVRAGTFPATTESYHLGAEAAAAFAAEDSGRVGGGGSSRDSGEISGRAESTVVPIAAVR
jgi:3-methyl-2-oxobutanoate hydroxymethyltransferase